MPPKSVIGAQMYTLRDHLKTPADMAKTCARVKKMGYDAIQVSAFGPIETKELAKMIEGEGLTCASTHIGLDMMKDVNKCVEHQELLKCKFPAIGGFWKEGAVTADWVAFAKEFSAIAKPLAKHGIAIGYHNHSHELMHYGGKAALDILISETDKAQPGVWFEIDTYWIAHGGGDPAAWIDKVAGRIPCVHFKDMTMAPGKPQMMTEVGSGNLNWRRIIDSCKKAGVQWYLVERDSGELDPFDSLKISLDNLRALGLN
ncbi:MAG: sugar phosphate isomerase/epimerase [Planctomycetes bacterium]|nr:sugar phosphate isomerase/epimerase [Planctomycetota bacterium]